MTRPVLSRTIFVLSALAAAATPLAAQLRWVDAAPPNSPAPRYGHGASDYYLIFGGRDDVQAFDDTWAYGTDGVQGDTWLEVAATVRPTARFDHAVAGLVGGILVFGGQDLQGQRFDDTWMLTGGWVGGPPHQWIGSWQQLNPVTSPAARTGHAMAYDWMTNTQCLLFGGRTDSGLSDETWTFANGQWHQWALASGPSAREGHVMVADGDGWLLFGGEDATGVSLETWRFDGQAWQQLADMPFAASDAATAFVPFERRRFAFVGGSDGAGLRDEVYERRQDGTWLAQQTTGAMTARRDSVVLQHLHFVASSTNQFRSTALAFGGRDANGTVLGDTMRLEATHVADVQEVSTGCGPGAWGNNGPNLFMQDLILGATRDLNVSTRSFDVPVFVGVEFAEIAAALPCQIAVDPALILFDVATAPTQPPSFGRVEFALQAPFDPLLRGAVLSMQVLAFDPASVTGMSLSGVLLVRLGD